MCGMQALGIRLEDYAKYPDAAPPKIQYPEIEVGWSCGRKVGRVVRKVEGMQAALHK